VLWIHLNFGLTEEFSIAPRYTVYADLKVGLLKVAQSQLLSALET